MVSVLKIDIGCGKNKKEGFIGIDVIQFEGVDHVLNVGNTPLPFEDDSVEEVFSSHSIEHLDAMERVFLVNELYRVMKKGAKATIIIPHWCSSRAYGDLTHKWPPVSEFWFFYLDSNWREGNAPHNDFYTCHFTVTWGYGLNPNIVSRNAEFQSFAVNNYKEAATDIVATLTKEEMPVKKEKKEPNM